MEIIASVAEMQERATATLAAGKTISFVPTMGFLHQGHASLLQEGRARGDLLVLSIFVNPTQFGVGEDFESYPRDLQRDSEIAAENGVDIIFAPTAGEMYPQGFQTYVNVENGVSAPLRRIAAGPFPWRNNRGRETVQYRQTHSGLFWRKGLPAVGGNPTDGPGPEHGREDRRDADDTGG